jgi:hypothetical protein
MVIESRPGRLRNDLTFKDRCGFDAEPCAHPFEPNNSEAIDSWGQSLARGSFPIDGGWDMALADGVSRSIRQMTEAATTIPEVGVEQTLRT